MKLIIERAKIVNARASDKTGVLYATITDMDTGAQIDINSREVGEDTFVPWVRKDVRIEMSFTISKFMETIRFDVYEATVTPLRAQQPQQPAPQAKP